MSEQREALAAVMREHRFAHRIEVSGESLSVCRCGFAGDLLDFDAHLADVILREWLPGALADERVVEAAARGVHEVVCGHRYPICPAPDDEDRDDARTVLTAAVTALTEDHA